LKNYPIQGLATGDIVPMMLGIIFRKLKNREDIKMVNTIHDSLMFDVNSDSVEFFTKELTSTLKGTDEYFHILFRTPLALKLNAGASVGDNWFNMKEI
jgi:DNA polymerase I-like protein with 3'-5' exonuclease and polymerase domains